MFTESSKKVLPMSSEAIVFKHVSKRYARNEGLSRVKSFLDRVKNGQFFKKLVKEEPFYALKDVSFTIQKGERVGIIGHNGAGKSTMLKIIGKISWPTSGELKIHGRTGGILELGAGFHPDLTARDNIIMTGLLYGYTKKEVMALFDQIVAISECRQFLDTPIKRYSSGMKLKLAFAIAMTTSPEIVLLDEAFAVGDARFKEKSTRMMMDFLTDRTLVLVSHSMEQIRQVCQRVIVLDRGAIVYDGPVADGCRVYDTIMKQGDIVASHSLVGSSITRGAPEAPKVLLEDVRILMNNGTKVKLALVVNIVDADKKATLRVSLQKEVLNKLMDRIDYREFEIACTSGTTVQQNLAIDTGNLYGGSYSLLLQAVSDRNGKTTAIDQVRLPLTLDIHEGPRADLVVNTNMRLETES